LVHAAFSFEDATFPFNPNQSAQSTGSRSSIFVADEQFAGQLLENKGACVGLEVAIFVSLSIPRSSTFRTLSKSSSVFSGAIKNVTFNGSSVPWQAEVNPMGRREVALPVEQQREG